MDGMSLREEREVQQKRKYFDIKLDLKPDKDVYKQAIQWDKEKYEEEKDYPNSRHKNFQRLKTLYRGATNHFPDEKSFWLDYVELCIDEKDFNTACFVSKKMTNFHKQDCNVWLIATELQVAKSKNYKNALEILTDALGHHHLNEKLWKKYFELLLMSTNSYSKKMEKAEDGTIIKQELDDETKQNLDKAKNLFNVLITKIHNVKFYTDLIDIASKYHIAADLCQTIYDYIKIKFSDHEITMHYLAQAELLTGNNARNYYKCIEVYKKAIYNFKTEDMATFYLKALVDMYNDNKIAHNELVQGFEECHKLKIMPKEKYINWTSFVETSQMKEEIFKKSLECYKESQELWEGYFQNFVLNHSTETEQVDAIFKDAVANCGHDSNLWTMYLQFHMLNSPASVVEVKFKESIKHFDKFKVDFLDWLVFVYGHKEAQQAYLDITTQQPHDTELNKELKARIDLFNTLQDDTDPTTKSRKSKKKKSCQPNTSNKKSKR